MGSLGTNLLGDELTSFSYRAPVVDAKLSGNELSGDELSWDELTLCQMIATNLKTFQLGEQISIWFLGTS